jgi:ferric-dicitrate binding protein FerR (iron transport regulator)
VIEFAAANTLRVLDKASLTIATDANDGNRIVVNLDTGRLEVKLGKILGGSALQVRTPNGVYSVVGTEFSVFYQAVDGGSDNTGVACAQGEVRFDSAAVTAPAIPAGAGITIKATEGEVSRVVEITVTQRLRIALGENNEV